MRRVLQWLGFVVLCNAVGFASAMIANEPSFYEHLEKPSWAPHGSVFGPVWTALYTLMGTATWLVWSRTTGVERRRAMLAFAIQLGINALWTPVFFGAHAIGAAIVVIIAVFVSVLVMLARYARVDRRAAWMVVPLALWVGFASALNIAIWLRNR